MKSVIAYIAWLYAAKGKAWPLRETFDYVMSNGQWVAHKMKKELGVT